MVTALSQISQIVARNAAARADALGDSRTRLASGQRLLSASDDIGSSNAAVNQQARISTFREALKAGAKTDSLLQTAENALDRIGGLLKEQQAVAREAAKDTNSDADRALLSTQFSALAERIDALARDTRFNGQRLLDGSQEALEVDLGEGTLRLSLAASDSAALFAGTTPDLSTPQSGFAAIGATQQAIDRLQQNSAGVRAARGQVRDTEASLTNSIAGLDRARDGLLRADRAAETLKLTIGTIEQETAVAVLAQAQQLSSALLDLVNTGIAPAPAAKEPEAAPEPKPAPKKAEAPTPRERETA